MTRKSRNKAASPAAPVTPAVVDQNPKRKYLLAAVITLLVVAGGLGFYFLSTKAPPPSPAVTAAPVAPAAPAPLASAPTYVGAEVCKTCHEPEFKAWSGSHHDLAMQEANAKTVLGNFANAKFRYNGIESTFFTRGDKFMVRTDGPDGKLTDYEIAYTFGLYPLQQYLIPFPGGRYQALPIAWDSRPKDKGGQRWFHLQPGQKVDHKDPLHWTGRYQN